MNKDLKKFFLYKNGQKHTEAPF